MIRRVAQPSSVRKASAAPTTRPSAHACGMRGRSSGYRASRSPRRTSPLVRGSGSCEPARSNARRSSSWSSTGRISTIVTPLVRKLPIPSRTLTSANASRRAWTSARRDRSHPSSASPFGSGQELRYVGQRDAGTSQQGNDRRLGQLAAFVIAVGAGGVDRRGSQYSGLPIGPQYLGGQPAADGELADCHHRVHLADHGPYPPDKVKGFVRRRPIGRPCEMVGRRELRARSLSTIPAGTNGRAQPASRHSTRALLPGRNPGSADPRSHRPPGR